jgi:hypothetical protein
MNPKDKLHQNIKAIQDEMDRIERLRGRLTREDLEEFDMLTTEYLKAIELLTESMSEWKRKKERETILNIILDCRLTLLQ